MSKCQKTSNNKYFNCPALMSDGRIFTDYRSSTIVNEDLMKVTDINSSYKYRQFLINNGDNIIKLNNDYINDKEQVSIKDYEAWKNGDSNHQLVLGRILEHEDNGDRGFMLHFCDEGCIIPNLKGLNYCPKGHSGYHTRFFPLYAVLESDQLINVDKIDPSFLKEGYVRVDRNVKLGTILEYEMRRIDCQEEKTCPSDVVGLLNWSPMYVAVKSIY